MNFNQPASAGLEIRAGALARRNLIQGFQTSAEAAANAGKPAKAD